MSSRSIDDLSERFRPLAERLLARTVEARIPVVVVCTRRTLAEHQANLAAGTSRTQHSKHLDGDAIDICPFSLFDAHGSNKLLWDTNHPFWFRLGAIGEALGLRWGGRFKPLDTNGLGWDPGHFEYVEPKSTPAQG